MFRSVLVPIDLSPASDRVTGRVARIPLTADAEITLLHVVPDGLPRHAHAQAEVDARRVLSAETAELATRLPKTTVLRQVVQVGSAASVIGERAGSLAVELVVMGRNPGHTLRDAFLGATAERVMREARVPVLVARTRPRRAYERPALAVAFDATFPVALRSLQRLVPGPVPQVTLIHAYEAPLQGLVYPGLRSEKAASSLTPHWEAARRALEERLTEELSQLQPSPAARWDLRIRDGDARTVIEEETKSVDADVLVLGTHGYVGFARAFLGSVAGDVLRYVGCDALMVPPDR